MDAPIIGEIFNKRYDFEKGGEVPKEWFKSEKRDSEERFRSLKSSLNSKKSLLKDLNLREWHAHTKKFNSAERVRRTLKRLIPGIVLSQSWLKCHEILQIFFPEYSFSKQDLKTFHVCESPGAFISALNFNLQRPGWSSWVALTLNSSYEGNSELVLNDDDFLISQTISHWDFGPDNSGDIFSNLSYYVDHFRSYQADFVTADGSFDCSENPAEQESIVFPLIAAEVIVSLSALKIGGALLLKAYTFFETSTQGLLYLLRFSFDSLSIFKPVTSREGNSEVYLICKGYNGAPVAYLKDWTREYLNGNFSPFRYECIPPHFIDQIYECSVMFNQLQEKMIERNVIAFSTGFSEPVGLKNLVAKEFVQRYSVKKFDQMVNPLYKSCRQSILWKLRIHKIEDETSREKTKIGLWHEVREKHKLFTKKNILVPSEGFILKRSQLISDFSLSPLFGKPFETLHNSKFCQISVMSLYRQALQLCKTSQAPQDPVIELNVSNDKIFLKYLESSEETVQVLRIYSGDFLDREGSLYFKKTMIKTLKTLFESLKSNESVIIEEFPLFSRFFVELLYVFSEYFDFLKLVASIEGTPGFLVMKTYKGKFPMHHLSDINIWLSEGDSKRTLLSIVSIDALKKEEHFFEMLIYYNFTEMLKRISRILEETEQV